VTGKGGTSCGIEKVWADKLGAMQGAGESLSYAIVRIAATSSPPFVDLASATIASRHDGGPALSSSPR
jgi:hypothetical protein